jgi:hypothetical protein
VARSLRNTRVVRQVAPRTQHDSDVGTRWPSTGEAIRDHVEERAPASGHDDLGRSPERPVLEQSHRQRAELVDERADLREALGRALAADRPLVPCDARELEHVGRSHERGDLERLSDAPAAGAPPGEAELHQHPLRTSRANPREMLRHELDPASRVDVTDEFERRIRELLRDPRDRGLVDHLVREEHTEDARFAHHARLTGRGGCDPPRARPELAIEQLRRHRRLAVRREIHAVISAVRRHHLYVVTQRRIPQHHHRWLKILEHRPPA